MSKQVKQSIEVDPIRKRFDLYDSLFKKFEEKLNHLEGNRCGSGQDENSSGLSYLARVLKLEDKLLDQKIQFEKKFLSQDEKFKAIMSRLEKIDSVEANCQNILKKFNSLSQQVEGIQSQLETVLSIPPQNKKKNNTNLPKGVTDENEHPLMTFQDTNRKFFAEQSSSKKLGEQIQLPEESCEKHLISYTNSPNFARSNNSHTSSPIHIKNNNSNVLQNVANSNQINSQQVELPRKHNSNNAIKSQLETTQQASSNNNSYKDNFQKINETYKLNSQNIYPQSVKNSRENITPKSSQSPSSISNYATIIPQTQVQNRLLLTTGYSEPARTQTISYQLPTSTKQHPSGNALKQNNDSLSNSYYQAHLKQSIKDSSLQSSLISFNKEKQLLENDGNDLKRSIRSNSMHESNQPSLRSLEVEIPHGNRPSIKYDYYFESNTTANSTKSNNKYGAAGLNSSLNSQQRPPIQMRTVEAFSQYEKYQPLHQSLNNSTLTPKTNLGQYTQQGRSESVDYSYQRQRKIDENKSIREDSKYNRNPIYSTIDINGKIGEQQQQQQKLSDQIKNFQYTPKGTQHSKAKEMLGRLSLERKVKDEKIQQFEKQALQLKRNHEF